MTYSVTRLPSAVGSLVGEDLDLDENQLSALFSAYTESSQKDSAAVIPAKMRPCPASGCLSKGRVNCGGGRFHRLDENVESLTGLMIDSDEGDVQEVISKLLSANVTHFVWQTYSHSEATPKHRVFVPFAAPLPIRTKQQWSRVFWPALIQHFGLDPQKCEALDKRCKNASRLYFLPHRSPGGTQRAWAHWGVEIDWSTVPGIDLHNEPAIPNASATYRDPARPEGEFYVDLEALRARLTAVRADIEARGVLGALVKGTALCPPPSNRKRNDTRKRRSAWLTATCWIANCAAGNETAEELLEAVARASFDAEVRDDPVDHTRWADIERMLEGAMADAPEYRAQEAHRRELREFANALGKSGDPASAGGDAAGEALEIDWQTQVKKEEDKKGDLIVTPTIDNVLPILLYHPAWKGALRFNEYKQVVELWGGPCLGKAKPGRWVKDTDSVHVAAWFARYFKYKLAPEAFWGYMVAAAEARPYHPVKDYLAACKASGSKHPGILDRWLIDFCAAQTEFEGVDSTDIIRTYGRAFLIGAVARVMRPGCQLDSMFILYGDQGIRKSEVFKVLADNERFFTDAPIKLDGDKDTAMIIKTNWIVEAAELEALARSSSEQQKAALTRRTDTFRPPYGKAVVEYPRTSVIAGTTNKESFLTDATGNRRFWIVSVGKIDIEGLRAVTPSLWAEAVAAYEAGEPYWLDDEKQEASNASNAQHMVTDAVAEKICECVRKSPQKKDFYTIPEILDFLDLPAHQAKSHSLANSMRRAGFRAERRYLGGAQCRGYATPAALLAGANLTVVK